MGTGLLQKIAPIAGAGLAGYFTAWNPSAMAAGAAAGSGLAGVLGQEDANATNLQSAREQMAFQERMRNTSYQAAVKDLQAAGLNPMLAYTQGGAAVPSGAMGTVQNAAAAGANSAANAASTIQSVQAISASQAQIEQTRAQTDKIRSETLSQDLNSARATAAMNVDKAQYTKLLEDALIARYGAMSAGQLYRARTSSGGDDNVGPGFRAQVRSEIARASEDESIAEARGLDLSRARQENKFWSEKTGEATPYIRLILDILRGVSSAGALRR